MIYRGSTVNSVTIAKYEPLFSLRIFLNSLLYFTMLTMSSSLQLFTITSVIFYSPAFLTFLIAFYQLICK